MEGGVRSGGWRRVGGRGCEEGWVEEGVRRGGWRRVEEGWVAEGVRSGGCLGSVGMVGGGG